MILDYLLTAVVFILIFSVLVLVHELGHFWAAKSSGIKVEEFGLGLPPRAIGKKKGETIYSLNWIPFGGFVKMLGEDASDPKMLKKKRSFASASLRNRIKVVIAGVVMNFLLAWVLLGIGFTFGMQPLLGPDDVLPAVDSGIIELTEGAMIDEVVDGSYAQILGFEDGDVWVKMDGVLVDEVVLGAVLENPGSVYEVRRDGEIYAFENPNAEGRFSNLEEFGLKLGDVGAFPRIRVLSVDEGSVPYNAGLRAGDTIISVNDRQVYSVTQFEDLIRGEKTLEYMVYSDGVLEEVIVELPRPREVVVAAVTPGAPAWNVGLQEGDVISNVNGREFFDSVALIDFVQTEAAAGKELAYTIERDGESLFFEILPNEEGKIGVLFSELINYAGGQEVSVYNVNLVSSVLAVNEQSYSLPTAFYQAFGESVSMVKLSGELFIGVAVTLVNDQEVPDTVAGPVGIAQMTHVFVQEGPIPLLRFVALLSLSLAAINILPLPALDGGRLLFLLIEMVIGRRVNQRWESYIHIFGYFLILLFIVLITFGDIARIFGS